MMNCKLAQLFIGIFALFFTLACVAGTPHYKQLVIFGDSYSDNGNTYRISQQKYPNPKRYANGRFSNGPVWTEYLATDLGLDRDSRTQFANFAYGQAQAKGAITICRNEKKHRGCFTVPDLGQQIKDYFKSPSAELDNALFVIFIGANDIFNHIPCKENVAIALERKVVTSVSAAVADLKRRGVKHILLIGVRAAAITQIGHQQAKVLNAPSYLTQLALVSKTINQSFKDNVVKPNNILFYNARTFDLKHYPKFKTGACYHNQGNYWNDMSPVCQQPANYFYYDRIHPTTHIHKDMAKAVYQYLKRAAAA